MELKRERRENAGTREYKWGEEGDIKFYEIPSGKKKQLKMESFE